MEIFEKLKNMSDRELLLFNIGETRSVRKLLINHLHTHELADARRWKIYLMLFATFAAVAVKVLL